MLPVDRSPTPDPALLTVRIRVPRTTAAATEEFLWTLDPEAVGHVLHGAEAELSVTLPPATVAGLERRLVAFLRQVGLDTAVTIATAPFREKDWADAYRQEFTPICVRDRLVVAPTWWQTPLPPAAIHLRIDPQMAFGTGHHPTTLACLEWLVRRAEAMGSHPGGLIDAGCGSGLLAIAAHHLGFHPVVAIDNDPIACTTARQNAATNDAAAITVIDGDLVDTALPCVPTLVANLTSGAILQLFPRLAAHVTPDGDLYLAGILAEQEETVTAAIAGRRWQITERHVHDPWLSLAIRRSP